MYRRQDHDNTGEEQYHFSTGSGSPPFDRTQFPSIYGLDSRLQRSPNRLDNAARMNFARQLTPIQNASTDVHSRLPLSTSASPHMNPEGKAAFKPTDRTLPSRDVTADEITNAFVSFILYCNPNFPLDVDVSTLRSNFQNPPKSDNKDFQTFRLFELIKKFDAKEIKTWAQLALDLGVEAPDTAKGQSVQKVQQYSVRLKRWMRATHIDAFFEYLLGKQHPYFLEIPHPSDPYPAGGRDGVLAEEDLAIRALDPSFRPKRGRRRNSETEQDEKTESGSATKQPRLVEGVPRSAIPSSAVPMSAHPDGFNDPWDAAAMIAPGGVAPWNSRLSGAPQSAAPTSNPNPLRWQIEDQTPASPFSLNPFSNSLSAHVDSEYENDPRSAVTPSTRKRRKHGPAVSSAWPSANAPGSKPRGRPPANRSIQDGPFGTFPADPTNEKMGSRVLTPLSGSSELVASQEPAALLDEPPTFRTHGEVNGRPGRLSLQVPQRSGAPVRLATPPQVLVNGETNEREGRAYASMNPGLPAATEQPVAGGGRVRTAGNLRMYIPEREIPGFAFEVLRRVLASDLLRAELIGRRRRLTADEAKGLADAVLDRLGVPRADTESTRDDIARLTAASWLGVGDQLNVPLGPAIGRGKAIHVTRFRTNPDGYEEIVYGAPDDDEDDGDGDDVKNIREVYDVSWAVGLGGCLGKFEMKNLTVAEDGAASTEDVHDLLIRKGLEAAHSIDRDGWIERTMHEAALASDGGPHLRDENVDWKARFMAMQFSAKIAKGSLERMKRRMLEQVLDVML